MNYKNFLCSIYSRIRKWISPLYGLNYAHDGLWTIHNTDFMNSPKFTVAYLAGKATSSWGGADIQWRVHLSLWLCVQSARLEGDFVECGTNRGGMATSILTYLADKAEFQQKRFYCFDTFEGLSEKYSTQTEYANTLGHYSNCFADVQKHFSRFPQVTLIKGAIPESLEDFQCDKVAFIHIDMNSAVPELAAAEFFWPHLVSGAYMLLDDFAWEACKSQREAFIEFARKHQVEILWLPTGQGLIQKP